MRLICLPFAGGGTHAYAGWATVGVDLEICPVLLPGRQDRFSEPAATRMDDLVPALADGLAPFLDRPYALFGHSMGGLIAFALTLQLARLGAPAPARLFLSGCAPRRPPGYRTRHTLPDDGLVAELREIEGTPAEFFEHQELLDLVLPTLRADFTLSESYAVPAQVRVPMPITGLAGREDAAAPPSAVQGWAEHTTAGFDLAVLPGGHFFLTDAPAVLSVVTAALTTPPGPPAPPP